MSDVIVSVRDLSIRYRGKRSLSYAVDGVSFDLRRGETMALVGESGSGKSTAGMALLKLLGPGGEILGGSILFDGVDVIQMSETELQSVRGNRMSMIFQDPVAGLNPVLSIGDQVSELLTSHLCIAKKEAEDASVQILAGVGLAEPTRVAKSYPFQLSGGMCQRVMIGIATALNPEVIIADEPTSSLDVTIQAQILQQLKDLRTERGTTILLITHDFGVVSQVADTVAVMYGGRIVESGTVMDVLKAPLHPYSRALMATLPRVDLPDQELHSIPGTPPELEEPAEHCAFLARCHEAQSVCRWQPSPPLGPAEGSDSLVACYNPVLEG
jgi:oligopeptide/dipeptide ABC transporter ATP-binding protein